jgi:putative PIG3 family NAD(P)H quinone oxidoreductase
MSDRLPEEMAVIEIAEPGGPQVLRAVRRPVPVCGDEEVLIRVEAAGVNRPDVMQRQGLYPPPPGASDIPGLEVAGEVVATGRRATGVGLGDRVCALVTGGGYAEYCLAAARLCLAQPRGLCALEAAALPETFFTVWTNVFDRAHLAAGETLLVHGGSSGIGTTAIQLARAFGARVLATAGNEQKCRACESLGAAAGINYKEEDFVERVMEMTDGHGADVVLDIVGGDYLARNLRCLAMEGRLVQIAVQRGAKTEVNLLAVMLKRLTITGSTLRPRPIEEKAKIADALRARVWPLLEEGRIKPVIHAKFALADAARAHALMEEGSHIGKIVLEV